MTDDFKTLLEDVANRRVSRRSALVSAAAGGAAISTGGFRWKSALAQESTPVAVSGGFVEGDDLIEPEVRESKNGVLDTKLTAKLSSTTVAGTAVTALVYDGMFPGPTLKFKSGDTMRVNIVNELNEMSNFHTHGFHVSPGGNSDNIFVMIEAGKSFQYEYKMPADHKPGLYWYHPHPHGISEGQVAGGLAGVIVNTGGLDDIPGIAGLKERLIMIQATQFDEAGMVMSPNDQSVASQLHLINGQLRPVIRMQPGETQRWRIGNISAGNIYNIGLEAHALNQIADDANPYDKVQPAYSVVLGPGERSEVLVQARTQPGTYELRSLLWGDGFQAMPDFLLASVIIEGDPITPAPLPTDLIPIEDLSKLTVDKQRTITFSIEGSPAKFEIDGKLFDENRIDQTVQLNALEEWVIQNNSVDWHPFHIHVNDFQVVAINHEPIVAHSYQDTYLVPPHGGSITMRSRFVDFKGKYVYHCHILFHEDHSMMGTVEVV